MKNLHLFFIATALFTFFNSNAQITKGNWLVGGRAYFNNVSNKNANGDITQTSTQINIQPNIGYFFYDRFVGGLNTAIGYSKVNGNNSSSTGYSLGPFLRYYFLKPEKIVNFLFEANYAYGKEFNNSAFGNSYAFKTGPVIFFNSSVGLELLAKYERSYYSVGTLTADSFQIGFGLQIHLKK